MKPALQFPPLFAERMRNQLGAGFDDFEAAMHESSTVAVRIHPQKWKGELSLDKIPWCDSGYYLDQRPLFTADPWFQGGAYYVQEPSSMFLEQAFGAIRLPDQSTILDMCAAPGGKTTHLLSLMKPDDLLVSNEVIRSRAVVLQENVQKWGYPNVVVTQNDPQDFVLLKAFFDLVVVDAPCSGEGLFRKDPAALNEWSPGNAALCAARQKRIVSEAWKCLKPGGCLIYSTCTFNPEENEGNLRWLEEQSAAEGVEIKTDPAWNMETIRTGKMTGYQFFPHRLKGEGFFISVIRKSGNSENELPGKFSGKIKNNIPLKVKEILNNWIIPEYTGEFLTGNEEYCIFPASRLATLSFLGKGLNIIQSGIPVASGPETKLNPHPALAYSSVFNRQAFPELPVRLTDAFRYLKKEVIPVMNSEKGWILVTYRDIPLGWIKNIGTRANNYFPKEWRIRMNINEIPQPWHETPTGRLGKEEMISIQ
mgnify:CR=1 FL=1